MSRVGHKYYGKTPVSVIGKNAWDSHDATKTWSDGGMVGEILERVKPELEAAVAQNVSLGVSEYLGDGEAAIRADDKTGELFVGLKLRNDEASLIVEVPLKKLIIAALTDLRDRVGVDPRAQGTVTQLVDLGRQLVGLGGGTGIPKPRQPELRPEVKLSAGVLNGSPQDQAQALTPPAPPSPPSSPPPKITKKHTKKRSTTRKPATLT